MEIYLKKLQLFLEKLDSYRDKTLFLFIKPYWPRKIIPNYVTLIRVVISIILFVLLFVTGDTNKTLIIWLFVIGIITDFIDGPIARGTDQVTELGAMLDSTSDRLLIIPLAVYGLIKFHKWLLLTLVAVELINALVSLFYKSREIYLESNIFGKVKMVLWCVPFIVLLFVWPNDLSWPFIYMLWITVPLSLLSWTAKILELKTKNKLRKVHA